jgi:hypothetical protein
MKVQSKGRLWKQVDRIWRNSDTHHHAASVYEYGSLIFNWIVFIPVRQ